MLEDVLEKIGILGCRFMSWLSDIPLPFTRRRIHSMKIYFFFHKLTWREDDWKYERK